MVTNVYTKKNKIRLLQKKRKTYKKNTHVLYGGANKDISDLRKFLFSPAFTTIINRGIEQDDDNLSEMQNAKNMVLTIFCWIRDKIPNSVITIPKGSILCRSVNRFDFNQVNIFQMDDYSKKDDSGRPIITRGKSLNYFNTSIMANISVNVSIDIDSVMFIKTKKQLQMLNLFSFSHLLGDMLKRGNWCSLFSEYAITFAIQQMGLNGTMNWDIAEIPTYRQSASFFSTINQGSSNIKYIGDRFNSLATQQIQSETNQIFMGKLGRENFYYFPEFAILQKNNELYELIELEKEFLNNKGIADVIRRYKLNPGILTDYNRDSTVYASNVQEDKKANKLIIINDRYKDNNLKLYIYSIGLYNENVFNQRGVELTSLRGLFNISKITSRQNQTMSVDPSKFVKTGYFIPILLDNEEENIKILTDLKNTFYPKKKDGRHVSSYQELVEYNKKNKIQICKDPPVCDYMDIKSIATTAFYRNDDSNNAVLNMVQYLFKILYTVPVINTESPLLAGAIITNPQSPSVSNDNDKKMRISIYNSYLKPIYDTIVTIINNKIINDDPETEILRRRGKNISVLDESKLTKFVRKLLNLTALNEHDTEFDDTVLSIKKIFWSVHKNDIPPAVWASYNPAEMHLIAEERDWIRVYNLFIAMYLKGGTAFRILFEIERLKERRSSSNDTSRLDDIDLDEKLGEKSDYDLNITINPYLSENDYNQMTNVMSEFCEKIFKSILVFGSAFTRTYFSTLFNRTSSIISNLKQVLLTSNIKDKKIDIDIQEYPTEVIVYEGNSYSVKDISSNMVLLQPLNIDPRAVTLGQSFLLYTKNDKVFTELSVSTEFILHRLMLNFKTNKISEIKNQNENELKCDLDTRVELIDISIVQYGGRERFKKWNQDKKYLININYPDIITDVGIGQETWSPFIKIYSWKSAIKDLNETIEDNIEMNRIAKLGKRIKRKNFLADLYCLYVKDYNIDDADDADGDDKKSINCRSLLSFDDYSGKYYMPDEYIDKFLKLKLPDIKQFLTFNKYNRIYYYLSIMLETPYVKIKNYWSDGGFVRRTNRPNDDDCKSSIQKILLSINRPTGYLFINGKIIPFLDNFFLFLLNVFTIFLDIIYSDDNYTVLYGKYIFSTILNELLYFQLSVIYNNIYLDRVAKLEEFATNEKGFEIIIRKCIETISTYRNSIKNLYNKQNFLDGFVVLQRKIILEFLKSFNNYTLLLSEDSILNLLNVTGHRSFKDLQLNHITFVFEDKNKMKEGMDEFKRVFVDDLSPSVSQVDPSYIPISWEGETIICTWNAKGDGIKYYVKVPDKLPKVNFHGENEDEMQDIVSYFFFLEVKFIVNTNKNYLSVVNYVESTLSYFGYAKDPDAKQYIINLILTSNPQINQALNQVIGHLYMDNSFSLSNQYRQSIKSENNLNIMEEKLQKYLFLQSLNKSTENDEIIGNLSATLNQLQVQLSGVVAEAQAKEQSIIAEGTRIILNQNSDIEQYKTSLQQYQQALQNNQQIIANQQNLLSQFKTEILADIIKITNNGNQSIMSYNNLQSLYTKYENVAV